MHTYLPKDIFILDDIRKNRALSIAIMTIVCRILSFLVDCYSSEKVRVKKKECKEQKKEKYFSAVPGIEPTTSGTTFSYIHF